MHTSRIKFFKGFQIEVTVTRYGGDCCIFIRIRRFARISGVGGRVIFVQWMDRRASSSATAFQYAFVLARSEIEKREVQGELTGT
ncbi:hypothetical protein [Herbaspirillum frisingense]|uniref:hypothetical protein n=1 Tax=Herbaspirillum frisingense TaxID=92645 RepID=UPI001F1CCFAE|nr:hypothetical protein [Herbaspirillum frisingense]UIN20306.1 hypothetical protein LAZ82_17730 [Herbaspirillum frisingense]